MNYAELEALSWELLDESRTDPVVHGLLHTPGNRLRSERECLLLMVKALSSERMNILNRFEGYVATGDGPTALVMTEALEKIRTAPRNIDPTAQWMQRFAAWGLEPDKWPKPEPEPPSATPDDAWAAPGDPFEDIEELTKQAIEDSKRARPPGTVTPAEVTFLQRWARARGDEVPEVKDGKFLGKVVVKL